MVSPLKADVFLYIFFVCNTHTPLTIMNYTLISYVDIDEDSIFKVIRSLSTNKGDGYDKISIRMIKICDATVSKRFFIIFENCINQGQFPDGWKKANAGQVHKNDKH